MDTDTALDPVLEGGGVKGIALVGAVSVLEEHGLRFQRVTGSSAGAIVGSLLAAGMSAADLHAAMSAADYRRFRDESPLGQLPLLGRGLALVRERVIFCGDAFHGLITDHPNQFSVRTFADLRHVDAGTEADPTCRYRLVVMASDISRGRLLRLPWDYGSVGLEADDQFVADAVRASMPLSFFFQPFRLDLPGTAPLVLVDGGRLSNFPVAAFEVLPTRAARRKHRRGPVAPGWVGITDGTCHRLTQQRATGQPKRRLRNR